MFNVLKRCRYGLMLFNLNDQFIGRSLDRYGEYSQGEAEFLETLLRTGDLVIEVGAHIGAHTLHIAQLVGTAGQVHAFEPQRLIAQVLSANLAINSIDCGYVYPWAVGDRDGHVRVPMIDYNAPGNYGALELDDDAAWKRHPTAVRAEVVPVVTLDTLFPALPRLRLLKIDVEGMEAKVLRGAANLIARTLPFLYVENDRPSKSSDVLGEMRRHGYDLYWHRPPLYNTSNFFKNPENVFSTLASINVFGIPPGANVKIEGLEVVEAAK